MDRIQAFRLFIRVVDLGSFSKAAADMGIGQPTATKQIAWMEKHLGARLLHRSTHGVTPTEVGVLYYDKCRSILHHIEEADSVAALLQTDIQGEMRISSSVAFGRRVLTPRVLRFMQLNPRLQIDLTIEDRYVDLVEHGVDVAIRLGRLADSTLGARYLGTNPWVLVAAPAYLAQRGTPADPAALVAHDALIYTTVPGATRWQFSGAGGVTEEVPVRGFLRSNSLSALLVAARSGMGIAALPWYVANRAIADGSVHTLLTDWSLPAQEIHAVYPSPNMVPLKVKRFIDWLQGEFGPSWWIEAP